MKLRPAASLVCLVLLATALAPADQNTPGTGLATQPSTAIKSGGRQTVGPQTYRRVVHPAALPSPPMKYTFTTLAVDSKQGNAATLYLMAALVTPPKMPFGPPAPTTQSGAKQPESSETIGDLQDKYLDAPAEELLSPHAADFLARIAPTLRLIDEAAACQDCQWEFPLPSKDVPYDLQGEIDTFNNMRYLVNLLCVRIRIEVAQKRYGDAVRSLRSGFAMSINLSKHGGFFPALVAHQFTTATLPCFEELEQTPGSPNCYWALAGLPHPFIDTRIAMQNEAVYARAGLTAEGKLAPSFRPVAQYEAAWDEFYTALLLPSTPQRLAALDRLARSPTTPKIGFLTEMVPLVEAQSLRLDRSIALDQCIEAIRAYAADHHGKPPAALADLTEAPAPPDPMTGKPFAYTVFGQSFTLDFPAPPGFPRMGGRMEVTVVPN
jgi:hypothetical protein